MKRHHTKKLTLLSIAVLLAGCAAFEVAPDQMPDDHGDDQTTADQAADDEHDQMSDDHGDDQANPDQAGDDEHDHADGTPPVDGAPDTRIVADALSFEPARLELAAGEPFNLVLSSRDMFHDLVIDEVDLHLSAERDETTTGGLDGLEPGTYLAYCSVPGHREAGMELEVVVG